MHYGILVSTQWDNECIVVGMTTSATHVNVTHSVLAVYIIYKMSPVTY